MAQLVRECLTRDWQEESDIVRWVQRTARRVISAAEIVDTLVTLIADGFVEAHVFGAERRPRYRTRRVSS